MKIDLKKYQADQQYSATSPSLSQTSVKQINWWEKDIKLFPYRLGLKQKEALYSELEVLLLAGLDLNTTLEMVASGLNKEKDKKTLEIIQGSVVNGQSLSEAMQQTSLFSTFEIYSIEIAEESGQLPKVLKQLSLHYARNLQYRRLLISALSYPVLVISVALLSLVFLLSFLVPIFSDIYQRLDQQLPTLTLWVVELSNYVQQWAGPVFLGFVLMGLGLYFQRQKPWYRRFQAQVLLRIPVFGNLIHQLYLARFTQAMAFLLGARVPMLRALDLVGHMISFYPIEKALDKIGKEILQGQSLQSSLSKHHVFPRRMIALVKVGEEANQLPAMFDKLAIQYNNEVEQRTKMLGSLIEPILIVGLAIIVGLVLVAMYLPIFKLVTNFGI